MGGLDNEGNKFVWHFFHINHVHLRTRNHDITRLHFRHLHNAFDHRKRIRIKQLLFMGTVKQFDQLVAVFRLAQQQGREALQHRALGGFVHGGNSEFRSDHFITRV